MNTSTGSPCPPATSTKRSRGGAVSAASLPPRDQETLTMLKVLQDNRLFLAKAGSLKALPFHESAYQVLLAVAAKCNLDLVAVQAIESTLAKHTYELALSEILVAAGYDLESFSASSAREGLLDHICDSIINERLVFTLPQVYPSTVAVEALDTRIILGGNFGRGQHCSPSMAKVNASWRKNYANSKGESNIGEFPEQVYHPQTGAPFQVDKSQEVHLRYMVLARVILGRPYVFPDNCCDSSLRREPAGFESVQGCVLQDGPAPDYVVYRSDRILPLYVLWYYDRATHSQDMLNAKACPLRPSIDRSCGDPHPMVSASDSFFDAVFSPEPVTVVAETMRKRTLFDDSSSSSSSAKNNFLPTRQCFSCGNDEDSEDTLEPLSKKKKKTTISNIFDTFASTPSSSTSSSSSSSSSLCLGSPTITSGSMLGFSPYFI